MAGTLTISTLSDGTNSTSSTNCIQGSAKAWVNFNGTGTPAVRTSYNVSSITRVGTGIYTINFTNALTDANFSCSGLAQDGTNTDYNRFVSLYSTLTSASSCSIATALGSNTASDCTYVTFQAFR